MKFYFPIKIKKKNRKRTLEIFSFDEGCKTIYGYILIMIQPEKHFQFNIYTMKINFEIIFKFLKIIFYNLFYFFLLKKINKKILNHFKWRISR